MHSPIIVHAYDNDFGRTAIIIITITIPIIKIMILHYGYVMHNALWLYYNRTTTMLCKLYIGIYLT